MKAITFTCLVILVACSLLVSCFSPWTGEKEETVTITIRLGNPSNARTLVGNTGSTPEYIDFTYELIIDGGAPIVPEITIDAANIVTLTATVSISGSSMLTIKAYGDAGSFTNFGAAGTKILRAVTKNCIPITANSTITAAMTSAMEVTSWTQLEEAAGGDPGNTREEIIFLKGNATIWNPSAHIPIERPIILRAEDAVKILSASPYTDTFFEVKTGGTLIMECEAGGSLTLDGSGTTIAKSIIDVLGGTLEINTDVTLENISIPGTNGGAVYVVNDGSTNGTFIMNGGTIANNTIGSHGGGVYVLNASFTINGGTINNNSAGTSGGGVFIDSGGTFVMSGTASITSNSAPFGENVAYSLSSVTPSSLQAACDTIPANSAILISSGSYPIDTPVTVNKDITITTNGGNVTLQQPPAIGNSVFTIGNGGKLTLTSVNGSETLSLDSEFGVSGPASGYNPVVKVSSKGELVIESGAAIKNLKGYILNGSYAVQVTDGKLTMTGGEISGFSRYGAVLIADSSVFTMSGGIITLNSSPGGGSGAPVGVDNSTFIMSGGATITNNNSNVNGGGVRLEGSSNFTMNGGTISGNYVTYNINFGGGVYVGLGATFIKNGGTIYGDDGTGDANRITFSGGYLDQGPAVYCADGPKYRHSNAGPTDSMNSSSAGAAGGWEIWP